MCYSVVRAVCGKPVGKAYANIGEALKVAQVFAENGLAVTIIPTKEK